MQEFLQGLQGIFLLGCVLPFVILVVLSILAFVFGKRWVEGLIEPDVEGLHQQMVDLKASHPDWDDDKLIASVVNRQAFKCGVVGAVTGFGGFATLPIGLPLDLVLTARYQASMVSFIAQVHGYERSMENRAATYAVMSGSTEVSKMTLAILQKYLPRFAGKTLSKLIPFIGAGIAFAVNYALAQSTARLAKRWYRSKSREQLVGQVQGMIRTQNDI